MSESASVCCCANILFQRQKNRQYVLLIVLLEQKVRCCIRQRQYLITARCAHFSRTTKLLRGIRRADYFGSASFLSRLSYVLSPFWQNNVKVLKFLSAKTRTTVRVVNQMIIRAFSARYHLARLLSVIKPIVPYVLFCNRSVRVRPLSYLVNYFVPITQRKLVKEARNPLQDLNGVGPEVSCQNKWTRQYLAIPHIRNTRYCPRWNPKPCTSWFIHEMELAKNVSAARELWHSADALFNVAQYHRLRAPYEATWSSFLRLIDLENEKSCLSNNTFMHSRTGRPGHIRGALERARVEKGHKASPTFLLWGKAARLEGSSQAYRFPVWRKRTYWTT